MILVFYDIFVELCARKGVSPSRAVLDMGFSKSIITGWKKGATPSDANLIRIADYFGVTVDYFKERLGQKEKPVEDDEPNTLEEAREILRQRGIRVLLDAEAKDFTPEQIKQIVNFILFTDEQSEK